MEKLNCVLLIDDNPADNRYHQIVLEDMKIVESIYSVENGFEALEYLTNEKSVMPQLIFLDINMPKMNGWEFLEEYKKLDPKIKNNIVIVILSTSANPADIRKSQEIDDVSDFETKPLTVESIENIIDHYF